MKEPYPGVFSIVINHILTDDSNLEKAFNINIDNIQLKAFVDASHGNDLCKRQSTTRLAFTFMGGAVLYQSKTQCITALSSTEAEFIAAHSAARVARFL